MLIMMRKSDLSYHKLLRHFFNLWRHFSAAQAAFMACAGNVAEGQLKNIPVLKMEIERILNNL